MDVWDRGDVPRAASQRTRLERITIAKEVVDDRFYDFVWETTGGFVCDVYPWRCVAEQAVDFGFASLPHAR